MTNNKTIIRNQLNSKAENLIGQIEYRHLYFNANMIAYSKTEFEEDSIFDSIQFLNVHLSFLKIYFFSLWMVKDNSADFDTGFLFLEKLNEELEASSNIYASSCYDALGRNSVKDFTKEELAKASFLLHEHIKVKIDRSESTINVKEYSRVTIANYYIQNARSAEDVGLKFASYCTALETLFSNDSTELSHKLSERVSRFLRSKLDERIEIFRIIKQSYNFRSKVVHGASFADGQINEMENIIVRLDNICREIMYYCLETELKTNIFYKNASEMEQYFLELIMK